MIIGICGGTGSGKTTIARAIVDAVGAKKVVLVEQDSYYRNLADMPLDERHQANFDHPDSIDSDMLVNHLRRLKQNLKVEMPLYDFKTHTRSDKIEIIEPKPVVIVEGILIFAEPRVLSVADVTQQSRFLNLGNAQRVQFADPLAGQNRIGRIDHPPDESGIGHGSEEGSVHAGMITSPDRPNQFPVEPGTSTPLPRGERGEEKS